MQLWYIVDSLYCTLNIWWYLKFPTWLVLHSECVVCNIAKAPYTGWCINRWRCRRYIRFNVIMHCWIFNRVLSTIFTHLSYIDIVTGVIFSLIVCSWAWLWNERYSIKYRKIYFGFQLKLKQRVLSTTNKNIIAIHSLLLTIMNLIISNYASNLSTQTMFSN